jgi:hypothetical protein
MYIPSVFRRTELSHGEMATNVLLSFARSVIETRLVRRIVEGLDLHSDNSLNHELNVRLAGRRAAIVYIDCDLYSSARLVLDFLSRYLVNGSIVCFDDFYCYKRSPDQGEQRALSEFPAGNNHIQFLPWSDYSPVGKSFILGVGQ